MLKAIIFVTLFLPRLSLASDFRVVYFQKSSGLRWSQYLIGVKDGGYGYNNGSCMGYNCTIETYPDGSPVLNDGYPQVKANDSDAAKACQQIGGRLPTVKELISLLAEFDHVNGDSKIELTQKGRLQFDEAFEKHTYWEIWWSSSVISTSSHSAFMLQGMYPCIGYSSRDKGYPAGYGVRCVK